MKESFLLAVSYKGIEKCSVQNFMEFICIKILKKKEILNRQNNKIHRRIQRDQYLKRKKDTKKWQSPLLDCEKYCQIGEASWV